jgi:hypothetical protein
VALGDGFDQGQPQTDATVTLARTWGAVKRLENTLTQLCWHAWAVVCDTQHCRFAVAYSFNRQRKRYGFNTCS